MIKQGERAAASELTRLGAGIGVGDGLRWRAHLRLNKFWGDVTAEDIALGRVKPYDVIDVPGNLLLAQGAADLWNALIGGSITGGYYNSSNAALGVADGNPTATGANCTFTNGSTTVNCATTAGVLVGYKIRLNADGNWYTVTTVTTDTSFTISTAYTGVTGTGAASYVVGEKVNQTDLNSTLTSSLGGGITNVTNANPAVFTTASAHGLIVGQQVVVASVGGATGANGTWVVSAVGSTTTFSIVMTAPGVYTSGGTVKLQNAYRQVVSSTPGLSVAVGGAIINVTNAVNPTITTTTAHGLVAGQMVTIASVGGATGVNTTLAVASVPTSTTFTVTLDTAPGVYTSGGTTTLTSILQATSLFGTTSANFAWNEWGLFNSGTVQSGSHLLNRKIIYLGAKSSAASWQLVATLSLA